MSKRTILADAYLHEYLYHTMLDHAQSDVLTDVALLPLGGYARSVISVEEADADVLPLACLAMRDVKSSLSLLGDMIEYPEFVNQIVSFADELAAYGITTDQLPDQDELHQDIKILIQSIDHLPKPHAWIDAFRQASFSADAVSYVSTCSSLTEAIAMQTLEKNHAKAIPLPAVDKPTMRLHKTLNARWEMEACIQDILLRQLPLEDVNIVLCGGQADLPLWHRLCEQYQLPYGSTFTSRPSLAGQGFCRLMDFLLDQTVDHLIAFLHDTWMEIPYRQELLTYLDRFIEDGAALWKPFFPLSDDCLETADRRDRDAYIILQQRAEQARYSLVQQIRQLDSPYQTAFAALAGSRLAQDEQELSILYRIKDLLEAYADQLSDLSLWPVFRHIINKYTISCARSWTYTVCVTDLDHPVPQRRYGYVLNATQANYPHIPSPSGIFSASYLEQIPHYPSAETRQTFYLQRAAWVFHMASDITCSYPTNDYEGKGKEAAAQLTLLIQQAAKRWDIRQADTRTDFHFRLSEAAAEQLWVKDKTVFGSVSSIESWFTCPFQHFLRYGLRINPNPLTAIDARRAGTILHSVMEYAINHYQKQYPNMPEEEMREVLQQTCTPLMVLYPKQASYIRLWLTLRLRQLQQTFVFLDEMEDATDFIPEHTEYAFEYDAATFLDYTLRLRGFIDRIDVDGNAIRILDYKSAQKDLKKPEVQRGVQLQLLTYLTIAADRLHKKPVGCYYVTFKHPNVIAEAGGIKRKPLAINEYTETEWQSEWVKAHRLSGWSFDQHTGLDRTGTHVKSLKENGAVMSQYLYDAADLMPWLHETYQAFLEQLLDGTIDPTPLEGACSLCQYRCICRNAIRRYPTNYEPDTVYFEKKGMKAMTTWSESQWEAITAIGKNLLVTASAGAGKTAVLTERLTKRILKDGIRVDQILAMTFTDAAAAEMKTRLYQRLHQSLQDSSLSAKKHRFLEQQLTAMANANISTIHSFCLSIIKQHSYMLHIDPQSTANILSDDEVTVLKQNAFEEAIERFAAAHGDAYQDLRDIFGLPTDNSDPLREIILTIANTARQVDDGEAWFAHALAAYRPIQTIAEMEPNLLDAFFDHWKVRGRTYRYAIEQLYQLAKQHDEVPETFLSDLQLRLDKLEPLPVALADHNYREVRRIFHSACLTSLATVKDEELKTGRTALMDEEKDLVASLYEEQDLLSGTELLQERVEALIELTKRYMDALEQHKAACHGMDFDDMEYYACQILKQNDFRIAEQYRQQFTDILVDEFQDTSERQNQIIEWISRGNNIFRVGDVKQSIYRFRGAKPSIMQRLMDQEDDTHHVISLQHNFRSNRSIVMYNNRLFDTLMNVDGLAQTYRKVDHVAIGRPEQDDQGKMPVEFHALSSEKAEGSQSFASPKAHYLIQTILNMKQEGSFTKWRDYCILVRSHGVKNDLRIALDEAGIPYSTSIHSSFYRCRAISDILQFLRYIEQPEDDVACMSVLTSAWYDTDADTLALWRSEQPKASFHSILRQHDHPLAKERGEYFEYGKEHGIWMLVQRLLMKQDYLLYHCSIQDRTNIDLYMERLQQYESKYGSDLASYLRYIAQIEQQDSAEAIAAGNEDDVVRIMTIHQSKGLQFPVVLFWSSSSSTSQDKREAILCDEELGIGLYHLRMPQRYRIPSIARVAIQHKNTMEDAAENIRLLYVALTRAQSKLIMVDTIKENYRVPDMNLATALNQGGYSELILSGSKAITEDYRYVPSQDFISPYIVTHEAKETTFVLPSYPEAEQKQDIGIVAPSGLEKRAPLTLNLTNKRTGAALEHGSTMHRAVELLPTAPWTAEQFAALPLALSKTDINDLTALSNNTLFKRLQSMEIHKEYSFVIREGQALVRGYMDYLALNDTDVYVIDFKTDHGLTEEQFKEQYAPQLQAYLAALRRIYPNHTLHAYLYSFFLKRMIPIS